MLPMLLLLLDIDTNNDYDDENADTTTTSAGFGYSLGAVEGSEEGKKLREALSTFSEVSAATGIFATPNARKIPPEEIAAAKANWKGITVTYPKCTLKLLYSTLNYV